MIMQQIETIDNFYNNFLNKINELWKSIDDERLKEIKFMLEMWYKLRQQDEFMEKLRHI